MENAIKAEGRKQEQRALTAIRENRTIEMSQLMEGFGEAIKPILRDIYFKTATKVQNRIDKRFEDLARGKSLLEAEDLGLSGEVINPELERRLDEQVIQLSKSTAATTSKGLEAAVTSVRAELTSGIIAQGESIALLTKRVKGVFENIETWRARRIAISESSRALADSQMVVGANSGVVQGYRLQPSLDACELCQQYSKNNKPTGQTLFPFTNMRDSTKQIGTYSPRTLAPIHPSCRCSNVEILDIEDTPPFPSGQKMPQFGKKPGEKKPKKKKPVKAKPKPKLVVPTKTQVGEFKTKAEAEKWANSRFENFGGKLDDMEKRSIGFYVGIGSEDINGPLREGKRLSGSPATAKKSIDSAFKKVGTEVDRDIFVYRGISDTSFLGNLDELRGATIKDKGFISTSMSREAAERFASKGSARSALIKIKVRKGTKAIWTDSAIPGSAGESELLLNRNTKMKVIEVIRKPGRPAEIIMEAA